MKMIYEEIDERKICFSRPGMVNRRMEYASSGALGALDVGFTICVFVQALCLKLDRRPNVMHAGEARDHGRMVTPSVAGTSGVDDPARGKRMVTDSVCLSLSQLDIILGWTNCQQIMLLLNSADKVVAVRDLCEISDQASGLVLVSAKRVRTLIRKRDQYSLSKCHKRYQSWKPRLIERFSLERKRISWEGEILDEDSRVGEKWQFWAVDTVVIDYTLLVIDYTLLVIDYTLLVNRRMEYASSGALGALDVGFTICVFVQALCLKLDRRPNVMHAGEARDHGGWLPQVLQGHRVLMIRRELDIILGWTNCQQIMLLLNSADKVVAVRDLCEISDQASGLVLVSAKRVRTLIRKRDQYSLSKCHKRYQSWKPRLIERFSLERKRISWEGEILDEDSRVGEKWQFWAVDTVVIDYTLLVIDYTLLVIDYTLLNFEEKRERRAFQEQGALGLILELEKREILRLEAVSVELEKLPRTKPNTHREPKFATLLEPKLATLLEPKFATLLEPKLAALLEPKFATLLEPKLATLLEPKSDPLPQARISQSQQPQNAISRPGEPTLAQARILQCSPGFHPPR
ncbi:hypothetical protein Lal_00024340 [Lupinus albus]|nr:hypothetical protein Lal_00024340 [Lupinus albus]